MTGFPTREVRLISTLPVGSRLIVFDYGVFTVEREPQIDTACKLCELKIDGHCLKRKSRYIRRIVGYCSGSFRTDGRNVYYKKQEGGEE